MRILPIVSRIAVTSNFVQNCLKLETTQVFLNRLMDKLMHSFIKILFSNKKECTIERKLYNLCMGCKNPVSKRYMLNNFICLTSVRGKPQDQESDSCLLDTESQKAMDGRGTQGLRGSVGNDPCHYNGMSHINITPLSILVKLVTKNW